MRPVIRVVPGAGGGLGYRVLGRWGGGRGRLVMWGGVLGEVCLVSGVDGGGWIVVSLLRV